MWQGIPVKGMITYIINGSLKLVCSRISFCFGDSIMIFFVCTCTRRNLMFKKLALERMQGVIHDFLTTVRRGAMLIWTRYSCRRVRRAILRSGV